MKSTRVWLAVLVAVFALPAVAAPPMSRGQQFFAMSHQDCLSRATAVLQQAGYSIWGQMGNGPWGDRGQHSAVILCEPAAGNREVVNIVVASTGTNDPNVPGAERVRLQELMEGRIAAPAPTAPAPATTWCVGFHGRWDMNWGPLTLRVAGNRFEGDHESYNGKVWGTIGGNVLDGQYSLPDGRRGTFRLTLSADGRRVEGEYQETTNPSNKGPYFGPCMGGASALQSSIRDDGALPHATARRFLGVWRQAFTNEESVIEIKSNGMGVFREVSADHARLGFRVGDPRLGDLHEVSEDTLEGLVYLRVEPNAACPTLPAVASAAKLKLLSNGRQFQVHGDDYQLGSECRLVPRGIQTSFVYERE